MLKQISPAALLALHPHLSGLRSATLDISDHHIHSSEDHHYHSAERTSDWDSEPPKKDSQGWAASVLAVLATVASLRKLQLFGQFGDKPVSLEIFTQLERLKLNSYYGDVTALQTLTKLTSLALFSPDFYQSSSVDFVLPQLRKLRVENIAGHQMHFVASGRFPSLTQLSLVNMKGDLGLHFYGSQIGSIESLDVSYLEGSLSHSLGWLNQEGHTMHSLVDFKSVGATIEVPTFIKALGGTASRLKKIDLTRARMEGTPEEVLAFWKSLTSLEELCLTHFFHSQTAQFPASTSLRRLYLSTYEFTPDVTWRTIANCPGLEVLNLLNADLQPLEWAKMSQSLRCLRSLQLPSVVHRTFHYVSRLTTLTYLCAGSMDLTTGDGAGLSFASLAELKRLIVIDTKFSEETLMSMLALSKLEMLNLSYSLISPELHGPLMALAPFTYL